MTITINRSSLVQIPERNRLVAEASSVGLAPGVWPTTVGVLSPSGTAFFDRRREERSGTGLLCVIYGSRCGQWDLALIND